MDFPRVVSVAPTMRLLDAFFKGLPYAKVDEMSRLVEVTHQFFAEVRNAVLSNPQQLLLPALGVLSACSLGSHRCPPFVELLTSPPPGSAEMEVCFLFSLSSFPFFGPIFPVPSGER